jgi:hypothetical protein
MASGQALTTMAVVRDINPGVTGVLVKAKPGDVWGWYMYNAAAAVRYLKLYDKATAPLSTDVPKMTLPIPAGLGANMMAPAGVDFTVGIGYRVTTGVADNDTGAPAANDVQLNLFYR